MTLLFLTFFLMLFPFHLYGWGGVAHYYFGQLILENAGLISSTAAAVIVEYPYDFLYGLLAADIIIGKKYTTWENHSHNWEVAFSLFTLADREYKVSFVWGYLSHLAMDVIAHNFFLPEMFIRYYHGKMRNHSYWEMKFETCFPDSVWLSIRKVEKGAHREDDEVLRAGLKPTLFSFAINRRLFDLLSLQRRVRAWKNVIRRISTRSIYKIPEDRRDFYINRSVDAALDILENGENAFITSLDPTGRSSIRNGFQIKRKLRELRDIAGEEVVNSLILENIPQIPAGKFSLRGNREDGV